VIVNPAALNELSTEERERVISVLQTATLDGGVHLVQTIAAASGRSSGSPLLDELRRRYRDWDVTVERTDGPARTFVARKGAA